MKPTASRIKKTTNELYFDILTSLCARFPALSPFDILNRPAREVFDLYIDAVVQMDREKKRGGPAAQPAAEEEETEIVYSWNATWH